MWFIGINVYIILKSDVFCICNRILLKPIVEADNEAAIRFLSFIFWRQQAENFVLQDVFVPILESNRY